MTPPRLDRPRLLLGLLCLGAMALPFVSVRASRIAAPEPLGLAEVLGPGPALFWGAVGVAVIAALVLSPRPATRLALSILAIAGLLLGLGLMAGGLSAAAGPYSRISPGAGAWTQLGLLALLFTDAAARIALGPEIGRAHV